MYKDARCLSSEDFVDESLMFPISNSVLNNNTISVMHFKQLTDVHSITKAVRVFAHIRNNISCKAMAFSLSNKHVTITHESKPIYTLLVRLHCCT